MRVAICIVGFRNAGDIARCLRAVGRSAYPDYQVVVCENGGPAAFDDLRATVPESLPGGQPVEFHLAPANLGFAGGVNACLRASPEADAWWVLNPDTEPAPDALAALVERLGRGDVDAVGGTLHAPDGTVQAHGGRWHGWLARAESLGHGARIDDPVDAAAVERRQNYLLGASMLIGRRFLETVGPMREDYFLYAEEIEWCLRARALGMRLGFAPGARVLHDQGATTGSSGLISRRPRLPIYLDERNKLHVVRDTTPARLPVVAVAALLLAAGRFARRGAWRQWGHALAGWSAGLRNRRGPPAWVRPD